MIMIFTGLVNSTLAFALTYILWEAIHPLQKEIVGYFTFLSSLHNYGLSTLGILR